MLTGVTGVVGFVVAVVLANDETACLGVVVVLVGVGFCTVETAGLAANFDGAEGMLEGPTLEGLGGATVAAGGWLVAGVGGEVVDTALAIAGFSWGFGTGVGLGDGTTRVVRNRLETPKLTGPNSDWYQISLYNIEQHLLKSRQVMKRNLTGNSVMCHQILIRTLKDVWQSVRKLKLLSWT